MFTTIESDYDVLDYDAGVSDEVLGKECCSCFRLLRFQFFDKNSAYKDGYNPQCSWCQKQPVMGIAEHAARLKELNLNSAGTRRQRHIDQEYFHKHKDSPGQLLDCSLFLQKLLHVYPNLYVTPGGVTINGVPVDISLFATSGVGKSEWDGNTFKYLGYVTIGVMPEYTQYEFDQRDILIRATRIGWRSVLLRFIQHRVLTEEQVYKEFGPPSGFADSDYWYKKLHKFRNSKT